jgi:hypothetical protein
MTYGIIFALAFLAMSLLGAYMKIVHADGADFILGVSIILMAAAIFRLLYEHKKNGKPHT